MIKNYLLSIVSIASIVFGFVLPSIAMTWIDYTVPLIMLIMFLTVLGVPFHSFREIKLSMILISSLLVFGVMTISVLFFSFLSPAIFAGLVILAASPAGMTTAMMSRFLKGDPSLGLVISTVTTLLSIIVIPIFSLMIIGKAVYVNPVSIFVLLVKVILIPFALAAIIQFLAPKFIAKAKFSFQYLILLFTFLLVWALIASGQSYIWLDTSGFLFVSLVVAIILAVSFLVSYVVGRKFGKPAGITMSLASGFKNGTLTFAIVLESFGALVLVPVISNVIIQYIFVVVFERLVKRKRR